MIAVKLLSIFWKEILGIVLEEDGKILWVIYEVLSKMGVLEKIF